MSRGPRAGLPDMRYLLVPGAGGQAWYWHRLLPSLPGAVAVELPASDPEAGLAAYADTIVRAAGPDPGPVTLVAQSMGGLAAPLVCDRLDVAGIVLLNAMIPRPGETGHEWWTATGHALDEPMDTLHHFFHDVPEEVTREAMTMGEPEQTDRPFQDPWPLAAWPQVPTRVLVGREDRFFPPAFQERVARERLGLPVELVPGGHLAALSRPQELAAALRDGR